MSTAYATRDHVAGPAGYPGGVAPEFNGLPDTMIGLWLDIASLHIAPARWARATSYAHALLTAHYLSQCPGPDGLGGDEVGPLTSEADGGASRSFASPAPTDAELGTTVYGRAFLTLRRSVRGRGSAVVANSGTQLTLLPSHIGIVVGGGWRW